MKITKRSLTANDVYLRETETHFGYHRKTFLGDNYVAAIDGQQVFDKYGSGILERESDLERVLPSDFFGKAVCICFVDERATKTRNFCCQQFKIHATVFTYSTPHCG